MVQIRFGIIIFLQKYKKNTAFFQVKESLNHILFSFPLSPMNSNFLKEKKSLTHFARSLQSLEFEGKKSKKKNGFNTQFHVFIGLFRKKKLVKIINFANAGRKQNLKDFSK